MMAKDKEDAAETLLNLAIGYFVIGPILMLAIVGIIGLIGWITA